MLDLDQALSDVERELAETERKRAVLDERLDALRAEHRGLELAIARHQGHGDTAAATNGQAQTWRRLKRTDAVLRVLAESTKSMSPVEITNRLRAVGRDDERNPVAAALAYLKRNGRVDHVGVGAWHSVPELSEEGFNLPSIEGGDSP